MYEKNSKMLHEKHISMYIIQKIKVHIFSLNHKFFIFMFQFAC